MNARSIAVLALGVILSGAVSAAPSKPTTAIGYSASKIQIQKWDVMLQRIQASTIVPGETRDNVQRWLGRPERKLSPTEWVYDNCQPNDSQARRDGCWLLVVTFTEDRVSELKFVNRPLMTKIIAAIEAPAPAAELLTAR
jgi:hypothetical protein